jgi:membrane-associated phospholipid phosphatase
MSMLPKVHSPTPPPGATFRRVDKPIDESAVRGFGWGAPRTWRFGTGGLIPSAAGQAAIDGWWILWGLGLSWVVLALLFWTAGLEVAPNGPAINAACWFLLLAGAIAYIFRTPATRAERVARDAAEYYGVFVAVGLFGVLGSYAVAAETVGYCDHYLAALDHRLGFDWPALYVFVARHPLVQIVERAAYQCIYLTPVALLAYYATTGRKREARTFIASVWVGAVLTLVLFMLGRAKGPLATEWHGPIPYMPASALYQAQLIPQLRSHSLQQIHLEALQGVVCAPSFHAASAVIYMAAAWRAPPLRWPLIAVNLLMLLATPIEGTHYLVDILAGAAVALVSVAFVNAVVARLTGQATAPLPA